MASLRSTLTDASVKRLASMNPSAILPNSAEMMPTEIQGVRRSNVEHGQKRIRKDYRWSHSNGISFAMPASKPDDPTKLSCETASPSQREQRCAYSTFGSMRPRNNSRSDLPQSKPSNQYETDPGAVANFQPDFQEVPSNRNIGSREQLMNARLSGLAKENGSLKRERDKLSMEVSKIQAQLRDTTTEMRTQHRSEQKEMEAAFRAEKEGMRLTFENDLDREKIRTGMLDTISSLEASQNATQDALRKLQKQSQELEAELAEKVNSLRTAEINFRTQLELNNSAHNAQLQEEIQLATRGYHARKKERVTYLSFKDVANRKIQQQWAESRSAARRVAEKVVQLVENQDDVHVEEQPLPNPAKEMQQQQASVKAQQFRAKLSQSLEKRISAFDLHSSRVVIKYLRYDLTHKVAPDAGLVASKFSALPLLHQLTDKRNQLQLLRDKIEQESSVAVKRELVEKAKIIRAKISSIWAIERFLLMHGSEQRLEDLLSESFPSKAVSVHPSNTKTLGGIHKIAFLTKRKLDSKQTSRLQYLRDEAMHAAARVNEVYGQKMILLQARGEHQSLEESIDDEIRSRLRRSKMKIARSFPRFGSPNSIVSPRLPSQIRRTSRVKVSTGRTRRFRRVLASTVRSRTETQTQHGSVHESPQTPVVQPKTNEKVLRSRPLSLRYTSSKQAPHQPQLGISRPQQPTRIRAFQSLSRESFSTLAPLTSSPYESLDGHSVGERNDMLQSQVGMLIGPTPSQDGSSIQRSTLQTQQPSAGLSSLCRPEEGERSTGNTSHADSGINNTFCDNVNSPSTEGHRTWTLSDLSSDDMSLITESTGVDNDEVQLIDNTTKLTYHIPSEILDAAASTSDDLKTVPFSFRLYENASGEKPSLHYCTSYEQAETQAAKLLNEPVLGFDLEWEERSKPGRDNAKRCVSVLQLASESKVMVFHLALFKIETANLLIPPSLREILESAEITKVGVNVAGDVGRVKTCFGLDFHGAFELSHLYKVVNFANSEPERIDRRLIRLAEQVQTILHLPLDKGEERTSAWSKKLDMNQLNYAASDAYAGFRLFHALEDQRVKMDPMPPRPAFWELRLPLVLGDGRVVEAKRRTQKTGATVIDEDDEGEEYFDAKETQAESEDAESDPANTLPSSSNVNVDHRGQDGSTSVIKSTKIEVTRPQSVEITRANDWIATWRNAQSPNHGVRVGDAPLRAYHLWHSQNMDIDVVASHLRNPPLAKTTVASYVLEAVSKEDLPYDAERIQGPIEALPSSVHTRFRGLIARLSR